MLNISERERSFDVEGYKVTISPQLPNVDISDSEWLIMNVRGFKSREEAEKFSNKLKFACETLSVSVRLGLDSGRNLTTSGFGKLAKEKVQENSGIVLRDNIHGLDVFEDNPNIRIAHISGTETVRASGEIFLGGVNVFFNEVEAASDKTRDIVLLLNYALMRPDPVAQIVFAFSAVEMLGQEEKWTPNQAQLIETLSQLVLKQSIGTTKERDEVSDAIRKGLYRLSLRQGVFRLLDRLDLGNLKKEWDKLYSERSILVHGLAPRPGVDYAGFAHRALSFCGHVLLTAVSQEVPSAKEYIEKFYSI
jgi:hypothetical protein